MLQSYYLNEIQRGKTGLGTYTLRPDFKDLMVEFESYTTRFTCHPNDIVKSIKERKIIVTSHMPDYENEASDNSRIIRAQSICQNDGISFSSRLGVFTVHDGREFYFVKLNPQSCSCPLKVGCIHVMAIQISLNMSLSIDGIQNLTTVRKNARGPKKTKPGRKKTSCW